MSDKKSILVIGSTGHLFADACVAWGDDFYVGDYDVVVISLEHLTGELLQTIKSSRPSYFENIKKHIVESQESRDFEVICMLEPLRLSAAMTIHSTKEERLASSNYSWSPIIPILENVPEGKKIDVGSSKVLPEYLKLVNGWSLLWESALNNTGYIDSKQLDNGQYIKTDISTSTLLNNNIGRYLAFKTTWKLQQENGSGYVFHILKECVLPMSFVPKISSPQDGIDILLDDIATGAAEAAPKWINEIHIADEDVLIEQIKKLKSEIESHEFIIGTLEKEKSELAEYKKLLYETGKPLEKIVEKSFIKLGITISSPKITNIEDRLFVDKDATIAIEIRGKNSGLTEKDLNQLTSRFVDKPESTEYSTRGMFVLNHFRDIEPSTREQPFHINIVSKASAWSVCLLSTTTLFELIKHKIEGNEIPNLADKIFNTIGIFKLEESSLEVIPSANSTEEPLSA